MTFHLRTGGSNESQIYRWRLETESRMKTFPAACFVTPHGNNARWGSFDVKKAS